MADRDRVSRCFLSLTLSIFLLALAANVTPVTDIDGTAHQSTTVVLEPERGGMHVAGTPHGPIAIDGDANFSDTALLEGWPGDGSPESPYTIDGLDIDLEGEIDNCISISNTRVSFIISNCNLTGATHEMMGPEGAGIHLYNVSNGELVNNTCNSNEIGIYLWDSDDNTVVNNTCNSNNEYGIYLSDSHNNTVIDNTCNNNAWGGIRLDGSHFNTVANNTCDSNGIGIYILFSHLNTVVNNTCTSNVDGISLDISDSNTLSDNTCLINTEHGIYLWKSHNNTVTDNTCLINRIGIYLWDGSGDNTVVNNTCNNNDEDGIYLSDSNSNIVTDNACTSNGESGIHLGSSNYNTVTDNTCNSNDIGIYLYDSPQNNVANNICNNNTEYGIRLDSSWDDTVENNTCNSNERGIFLVYSQNNTVANNICTNNNPSGIFLYESNSNTVENNTCTSNTNNGIDVNYHSNSNTVANNTCNSNIEYGIYLVHSASNTVVYNTCNNNRIGIHLYHSDSSTVANNTCNSNEYGIYLTYSPANTVVNNTCNSNTEYGIGLVYSQNNTVANNICNNNRIGIYLYDSPQNTVTNNTFFNNTERAIYFYDSRIKAVAPLLVGLVGIIALAIVRGPGWRRHYREYLQAWRAWQLEDKTRREASDEEIRRWGADQEARLKEEKRRIASEKSSEDDIDIPRMRIAGQVVDLRFWLKTSIKVSLLLLTPVWAFLECEASLALSDYGGNYNCMLFTMFAPQFSEEIFINIRGLDTILAAIIICVPGIYFTRRLAHQPKTTPIKDLALASGFATSFVAMYCVYGNSLSYDLLTMGSMALVLFVFLPIFVREAELVGLAKVLRERQGNEDIKRSWVQRQTMPRRYALVGNALALFAFLSPYYVLVETRVLEVPYQILYQYQVFSALVGTTYQNRAGGIFWIVGAPYWSFGNAIFGMDLLFNVLFFMGARFLYAFGILRYWRGKTSSRKVVLAGAIGILLPAIILQSVQVSLVSGTLVFSSPLPILFLGGLLAIGMIQPKDYENLDSVELTSEVDIPLFYTLRSRVALVVSRLRRREADTESESEKQAS